MHVLPGHKSIFIISPNNIVSQLYKAFKGRFNWWWHQEEEASDTHADHIMVFQVNTRKLYVICGESRDIYCVRFYGAYIYI
jgi:hypothetical protein